MTTSKGPSTVSPLSRRTTRYAPSALILEAASEFVIAVIVAPSRTAACTLESPMPPLAPRISACSPALRWL
jgi:hypothetical protein